MKNEQNTHYFNVVIADEVGVEKAIILNHLEFWIANNANNEYQFHDGHYWTWQKPDALLKTFHYFTNIKKIYRLIQQLEADGFIIRGNYNKHKYDRTSWYSLTDKYYQCMDRKRPFSQSEPVPKSGTGTSKKWHKDEQKISDGSAESVSPIQDNTIDNTIDNTTDREEHEKSLSKKLDDKFSFKDAYEKKYFEKKETTFFWNKGDTDSTDKVIEKLKQIFTDRNVVWNLSEAILVYQQMIDVDDQWIQERMSPQMLNKKFNEIINTIENGKPRSKNKTDDWAEQVLNKFKSDHKL